MNKKFRILILALMAITAIFSTAVFAQTTEPVYISPNNDGIQDVLSVPVTMSDKRYIKEWSFVITNAQGVPVRTIDNKDQRESSVTFKSFFSRLFAPKGGVAIPDILVWNGILDSGETAPDGSYFYFVTAKDDNSNQTTTSTYKVIVDCTAPSISITVPQDQNLLIFSPDGDGNKDTILIQQTGSKENLWKATISNSGGTVVRNLNWENAQPKDFTWDGKTDTGTIAPDGVYSYKITSTDQAGNTGTAQLNNIILDTEKPAINIAIDINAFSPNGDGIKDGVKLSPIIPVTTGLVQWNLAVIDSSGKKYKTWSGTSKPSANIEFDGRDTAGRILAEGTYQAELTAAYINGYEPRSLSPLFTLDITPPEATVRASLTVFSPNGDKQLDTIQMYQQASSEIEWLGTILNEQGAAIKTWRFNKIPPETITWDGMNDKGGLAPDGMYTYRLTSTDRAGNTGTALTEAFELNIGTTEVILTSSRTAFSTVGTSGNNMVVISPVVKTKSKIKSYKLTYQNENNEVVKTIEGKGSLPAKFEWNGTDENKVLVPDGRYSATLETVSENGSLASSTTPTFVIDSVHPSVAVTVPYLVFSPNADGKKDSLPINIQSSTEDRWTGTILDSKKQLVRTYIWDGQAKSFEWNGTDEAGNLCADGTYSFFIESVDEAGNKVESKITDIQLDSRVPKAYLTAASKAISPNGDGVLDTQRLSIVSSIPEGLESWTLSINDDMFNNAVKTWSSSESKTLPAAVTWDGKDKNNKAVEGVVYAMLKLTYIKGDEVSVRTPAFICSTTPPELSVKTQPEFFSPDNDGEDDDLIITLKGKSSVPLTNWTFEIKDPQNGSSFWKTSGTTTITERLVWDGRSNKGELVQSATDYPYVFTATDELGMTTRTTGFIFVDVLVIRIGDVLKIQVPSIIFRKDEADFEGLAPEIIEKNTFVLKRIANILNKFKEYKVTIEGHANNVTGMEYEEINELLPLSEKRANTVREILIKNGVDKNRLSTIGMGGRSPVVPRSDKDNWWKNRRVEFILNK